LKRVKDTVQQLDLAIQLEFGELTKTQTIMLSRLARVMRAEKKTRAPYSFGDHRGRFWEIWDLPTFERW